MSGIDILAQLYLNCGEEFFLGVVDNDNKSEIPSS